MSPAMQQRAVLAMLGLEANGPVSADRLIDGLWGEDPPPSAAKMVQNYVLRLRKALADDGGAEIVTRGRAYELRIDRELFDACRLERLVAEASRAAESGRFDGAAREALALFAGEPLADVAHEPFAGPEIRRLQELRVTAAELAIDADLATGQDQEIVPEIDALLAAKPLRERLHAQRMLALYRSGRQAEALEAYRTARRTLVDEVGIEPTPELRELPDAILRQDPALLVERARPELPPGLDPAAAPPLIGREEELQRRRARWRHGPGLVTVAGAYGMGKTRPAAELAGAAHREGATVVHAAGTGSPEAALVAIARARAARGPVLLVLDDADRAAAAVRVAARGAATAAAADSPPFLVLATGQEAAALCRLEPDEALHARPGEREPVGPRQVGFPHALSPDGTVLAVGAADGSVTAIDVRTLRPLYRTHAVNRAILALAFAPHNGPLVAGAFDGTLVVLDARRGTVVQRASGGPGYEAAISFSADGHRTATLSFTAGIRLWTLRAGRVAGEPRLYLPRSGVTSLSLSPDGHRLAMAGDHGIEVIDTATLARPVHLAASDTVRYLVQFTSDGRSSVGGSEQGWTRLWSAATLKPVTRPLRGGAAPAQWASVSPDGRTLATGSTDGDVRLFDLTTQRQIGAPLPAVPNQPTAPLFTPAGAYLLALSGAGRGYRWDVRPATWERQACAVAGRTLTRAEWADVLPGRPYAPACS